MFHLQTLPLFFLWDPYVLHNSVLGLGFRLCDQVLLGDRDLPTSRSPAGFFTTFDPREEPVEGAFGCKGEDQLQFSQHKQ